MPCLTVRYHMTNDISEFPNTGRFLAGRLRHAMTAREKNVLEGLVEQVETFEDDERILKRGAMCEYSTMLIEGFAVRTIDENGNRYVVSVQTPGDFMDLHSFALKRLDHNLVAIGTVKVGIVPHAALSAMMDAEPHLSRLFWFSTLLDAAIHRQWILKLHQLKASRRTAHLLAEIWQRLEHVGLALPDGFASPLTQSDLAEMCGTTSIHMNRSLGELRRKGIADFKRGRLVCNTRALLEKTGDFDPAYLYATGELAPGNALDPK